MKDLTALALMQAPALLCAGAAGALAYFDKAGWGWFLIAAALMKVGRARIDLPDSEKPSPDTGANHG